jgi:hypothetical protein
MDGAIEGVALVNADALACESCRTLGDRLYLPWVPTLPIPGCTSPRGCLCYAEPAFTVVEQPAARPGVGRST